MLPLFFFQAIVPAGERAFPCILIELIEIESTTPPKTADSRMNYVNS